MDHELTDVDINRPIGTTREAIRKCAEWLATCRRLGWRARDLDFLEQLWWKYHDKHGDLIDARHVA